MNPEERALLERSLKLSEETNAILQKMLRAQRRATIYGFIKLLVIVVPLILGYLFLQPYIDLAGKNFETLQELVR